MSAPQDIEKALRMSAELATDFSPSPTLTRSAPKTSAGVTGQELTTDETDGAGREAVSGWNHAERLKCVKSEKLHRE